MAKALTNAEQRRLEELRNQEIKSADEVNEQQELEARADFTDRFSSGFDAGMAGEEHQDVLLLINEVLGAGDWNTTLAMLARAQQQGILNQVVYRAVVAGHSAKGTMGDREAYGIEVINALEDEVNKWKRRNPDALEGVGNTRPGDLIRQVEHNAQRLSPAARGEEDGPKTAEDDPAKDILDHQARRRADEQRIREARREAVERAMQTNAGIARAAGFSADRVDRNDRFFARTSDGTMLNQAGQPITERMIADALVQIGAEDTPENRRMVLMQLGKRREALLPDGFEQGYIATEEISRENLGGFRSADRLAHEANRRGVETDADGNIVIDEHGNPQSGDDALVRPNQQMYTLQHAQRPMREMNAEQIGQLQAELVKAGTLTGDFIWGRWDSQSQAAYIQVLEYANVNGISERDAMREYQSVLDDHVRMMMAEYRQEQQKADPRLNQSFLREQARSWFAEMLGRDPSTTELYGAARQLHDLYEQQVMQERAEEVRSMDPRSIIPEEFGGSPLAGEDDPAMAEEAVDVQAQFAEAFRNQFGNEIDMIERREFQTESQQAFGSIGRGLRNLS